MEADKKKGAVYDMYSDLADICNGLAALHRPEEALDLIRKTTREIPPTRTEEKMNFNEALGTCYSSLQQYGKAQLYFEEMIRLFEIQQATTNMPYKLTVHYYRTICEFYIRTKEFQRARFYIGKLNNIHPGIIHPLIFSGIG